MNYNKKINNMKKTISIAIFSTLLFSCTIVGNSNSGAKPANEVISDNSIKVLPELSQLEIDTFKELNLVRTSPKEYAEKILENKKYYNGNNYEFPGEITIVTQEGVKAVDECYNILKNTEPLEELTLSAGLSKAAKDLVKMQSVTEQTGHNGTDGSSPFDRISKYGTWSITSAENIDYGNNKAEKIVMSLLIDDGVASRGHRLNILNKDFKFVGVSAGDHKLYKHMFVMDFAGGYKEK